MTGAVDADRGSTSAGDPYTPTAGNGGYRVEHYDLDLRYRVGPNRLSGRAAITAVALQPLARFSLDLAGLQVGRVSVDGRRARWDHRNGKLHITPPHRIPASSRFEVAVQYSGNPHPLRTRWGTLGWEELTDGVIVASQPTGAHSWFPCDDHPRSKATYRTSITADSPYTVVANGALVRTARGGSHTTWEYEQAEPMAAYLATVQIGQYEVVDLPSSTVPIRAVVPARLVAAACVDLYRQGEMLDLFVDRFGPYPFPSYAVVVTDDPLEIPLEAQGLSVFGANHIDGERGNERLVAHELAHQWFGNAVTAASWQHIWLHEGFACYAEWLWSEASGGPSAAAQAAEFHAALAALPQDLVVADPGPEAMFDDRVYKRGALTLQAVRTVLGDDSFFEVLRTWVARHRYGNAATADFVALVAEVADGPVDALFHAWLEEPGLPALTKRRR